MDERGGISGIDLPVKRHMRKRSSSTRRRRRGRRGRRGRKRRRRRGRRRRAGN